jgi:hypothetical protein
MFASLRCGEMSAIVASQSGWLYNFRFLGMNWPENAALKKNNKKNSRKAVL